MVKIVNKEIAGVIDREAKTRGPHESQLLNGEFVGLEG
jgi:hypothetical protein